jgi:[protein-PII] uridylyltransferase
MNALPIAIALPRLPAAVPRSGVSSGARLALRQLLGDTDRRLGEAFRAGAQVDALTGARAAAVERIVAHIWTACIGESESLALFAVGGFGRAELFPFSDVDLLALSAQSPSPAQARALEAFFARLWDVGLKPGHALRTVHECRALAAQDATVYTNLFDARRIAGSDSFDASLRALLADASIWPAAQYLAAKIAERKQRHARFDDTAYNLEPNLKDGPGGLRSVHLLQWLGRRLLAAPTLGGLAQCNAISTAEAEAAASASALLARIRFGLHLAAGRAEERLLFDYQRTLAAQFGFADEHGQNLAVEQFMQGYYRAAIGNERLLERFLQRCEERLEVGSHPHLERLSLDFVAIGGRMDCEPAELLMQRPAALIDLFRVWVEHAHVHGLRANFLRRIDDALSRHGEDLAHDDDVNSAFLRLLRLGVPAVEALVRMSRSGVLARYLPAFGRVVGRMQYDLFHMYTVDEHTLRVLRVIARFADAQASRDFAHAHELWSRLAKPELLLLAALFHDIAKGRGGDHSELGELEARQFCARLHLPEADVERVAWLVRQHLLMSVTAQRKDIADPEVVRSFAVEVADWERLDYLYLLTVADISGTSARLWNSWKDRLLSDLYVATRYRLRSGDESTPQAAERAQDCRAQALALLVARGVDAAAAERIWAVFPAASFLRSTPQQIALQTAAIAAAKAAEPLVLIDLHAARGATEIFVHAPDRDGLFAAITAALDRQRLWVLDARIATASNGMSLDSFMVLDGNGRAIADPGRVERLRMALLRALAHKQTAEFTPRAPSRVLRHFPIPVRIAFEDTADGARTQLAIVCADRPGLLAGIARVLRDCAVRVHDARIATFGERVEDFFQIDDAAGRPLSQPLREQLSRALRQWLEPAHSSREQHVNA